MKLAKENILSIICIIMLTSFIIALANIFTYSLYSSFFWMCYTGMLIITIGIWNNKPWLILSQVIILTIPDILWIIDFLAIIFTGTSPFNLASYFFEDFPLVSRLVSLQHLYTIPLSLIALYIMKIDKESYNAKFMLIFSLIQMTLFFVLTRFFVTMEENVNCVYFPCFDITITNYLATALPYFFSWMLVMITTMIVTYYGIISLPIFREINNKSR